MHTGNTIKALVYQQNIADTYHSDSLALLLDDSDRFNVEQALKSFILKRIIESAYSEKAERSIEGIDRGKLAFLLDSVGMKSHADEEWKRAIELTGYRDTEDAFKKLISRMINDDIAVSNRSYVTPKNLSDHICTPETFESQN